MTHLIEKSAVVAEINKVLNSYDPNEITSGRYALVRLRDFLDTLEVKDDMDTIHPIDDVVSNDPIISPELLTASAAYAREQLANPDYPIYNDEYELLCAFEAGAKWQEAKIQAQSMAVAHGCPKETVIYGQDQTMNSSNKFPNLCQTTKR